MEQTIHLHDSRIGIMKGIVDGAALMHGEMARLLEKQTVVRFHDLAKGREAYRDVQDGDVVYAGSGPYAWIYHHARAIMKRKNNVRIVREVHTSFWSGYWAQEELCADFLEEGDVAVFPTEFCRRLYLRHFPHLKNSGTAVAYPLEERLRFLSKNGVKRRPRKGPLRIGYLGALSEAKNFDQVLAVFELAHRRKIAASLSVAGKENTPTYSRAGLEIWRRKCGISADAVRFYGILNLKEIAGFLAEVDVLLFPSTASRETLGRVALEGLAAGVPVMVADMGPAVELVGPEAWIPTSFRTGDVRSMDRVFPLGRINVEAAVDMLSERIPEPQGVYDPCLYASKALLSAIQKEELPIASKNLQADERIAQAVHIERRTPELTFTDGKEYTFLFENWFGRNACPLKERIASCVKDKTKRQQLFDMVATPERNLMDYRAFPRLMDEIWAPPLSFTILGEADAWRKSV